MSEFRLNNTVFYKHCTSAKGGFCRKNIGRGRKHNIYPVTRLKIVCKKHADPLGYNKNISVVGDFYRGHLPSELCYYAV